MNGKLIVIEGLDGSGKATQTKRLYDNLAKEGLRVKQVSFPNYESDSSALAKMYLHGAFGDKADDVNAFAASSFFSVDRYASYKLDWERDYLEGAIILSDRYTTSNAVHQTGKMNKEEWNAFTDWLYDFEYNKLGIPSPDLVVFLSMSPAVSQKLLEKRYMGDESKKDIHEYDRRYLERCREAALFCAETQKWSKVECDDGKNPFSLGDIEKSVLALVKTKLSI